MAEPRQRPIDDPPGSAAQPGLPQVFVVAATIVLVVALAVAVTELVPGLTDVVYGTPIAIGVLVLGTGLVLWRITRRRV